MERTMPALIPEEDVQGHFIARVGEYSFEVRRCCLTVGFYLKQKEVDLCGQLFRPTSRNPRRIHKGLRLTLRLNGTPGPQLVVTISPKDAEAKYGTRHIEHVAKNIEHEVGNLLRTP